MIDVFTVGYVTSYEGETIELPIFQTKGSAIKYMEDVVMKVHLPNSQFMRDDSELDKDEIARWYQLSEMQQLKDNKVVYDKQILKKYHGYYRVLRRDLI